MNTTSFNYFIRSILSVFQTEKAVATLFLILCAAVLIWPTLGWQLPFYYGDTGDARFNMYLLEHSYQFVCRPSSHFWNAPFFYPTSEVITYSDNHLGIAPIYYSAAFDGPKRRNRLSSARIKMSQRLFRQSAARLLGILGAPRRIE